ncbi:MULTISPECIES: MBL fold metallo-hydrolase [Streptomyces]|uniref:Glyoxylase-like metal-dependent hydrolase (Beta-lactamase superfamily II) n=2 Tax=Streptomyces TaxID=1883 RepID=A0ABT9L9D5_STRGD|nr:MULTISPECIES: MBL fold metallo-hydrolase [Streptomyces]MDP9680269.1 glyoxylase-like metal-dependent hydrolase (beta-lactamase superfamily II) [Streptomyces griseoviridis]GGT24888.1 MBL fold hydrolase [Streptomyces griseoviridis]GGU48389.1 MBL fold hydrolase [Streptomyces daghestanicus]GHI29217.1 MBL fold hydrolase [Streptomyces daghestanicus]
MATSLRIGHITVTALDDGVSHLPPLFYPGLDFEAHPGLLEADRTYHIPARCFLVQGDGFTVLVDAGIGPQNIHFPAELAAAAGLDPAPEFIAAGGALPEALAAVGVAPQDVTTVFLTHLHADHVGWAAPGGKPFFPGAEVVYGAADWDALIATAPQEDPARIVMEGARKAGVLRPVDAAVVEIAPGVVAHHTPGHTPGHYVVRVTGGDQEVYLTGDAVHHPLQLDSTAISFLTDVDPEHTLRTRQELLARIAGRTDAAVGTAHFPGRGFQRVRVEGAGRTWADV